ncbi:hypothetical protein BsWGS_14043 [Bradybaena similaris]
MASKSEELTATEVDNNQDSDDEPIGIAPESTPLNPSSPPYTPQNQPYPYHPDPQPANAAYPPAPYIYPQGYGPYGMQGTHSATTVIVQQPSSQPLPRRNWSSKLCDCGKEWSICCCGVFCLCCLESQVVNDMDESCMVPYCVPGWLIVLRTKMRTQENITGSVINDCCDVICCYRCALCQLAYEIKVVNQRVVASAGGARPV